MDLNTVSGLTYGGRTIRLEQAYGENQQKIYHEHQIEELLEKLRIPRVTRSLQIQKQFRGARALPMILTHHVLPSNTQVMKTILRTKEFS